MRVIVIRKELQLQFVGQAVKPLGIAGGDHGIGQLPYLAHGILEGAVAVDHRLNVHSRALEYHAAYALGNLLRVPREELYRLLGCLVGAQKPVFRAAAAAVHGCVQYVAEGKHVFAAVADQALLRALASVDIAAEHVLGAGQYRLRPVGKDYLRLRALGLDERLVEGDVIHSRERVTALAPAGRVEFIGGQRVLPGVYARVLKHLRIGKVIAHLV